MKTILIDIAILSSITAILTTCTTGRRIGAGYGTTTEQQITSAWRRSMLLINEDSTRQYWYYGTDSTFYFHPDSGLYGHGGILQGLWQHSGRSLHMHQQDSMYRSSNKNEKTVSYTWQKKIRNYGLWIPVGVVLVLLILWRWLK